LEDAEAKAGGTGVIPSRPANALVHSWNLFEASLYADNSTIGLEGGILAFGLLNFFDALVSGTEDFLNRLPADGDLLTNAVSRYEKLRATAKP